MSMHAAAGLWRVLAIGGLGCALAGCGGLAGCQADYAADITNKTPQPLFAQIFRKGGNGAVLGAQKRLGPGDRASIGPVRNQKDYGAYLSLDTMPNPTRPVTVDLVPGTSFFDVLQDGTGTVGPLRVAPK